MRVDNCSMRIMTDRHFWCLPTYCLHLSPKMSRLNNVTFKESFTHTTQHSPCKFTLSHKQEIIPNTLMDYFVHVVAIPRHWAFRSMAAPFCPFDNRDRLLGVPSCCSLPLDIIIYSKRRLLRNKNTQMRQVATKSVSQDKNLLDPCEAIGSLNGSPVNNSTSASPSSDRIDSSSPWEVR